VKDKPGWAAAGFSVAAMDYRGARRSFTGYRSYNLNKDILLTATSNLPQIVGGLSGKVVCQ
jgi:hypothetical protein